MSDNLVKRGLAQMLKRGVIMDVTTAKEAKLAEEAGAVAVMALENVPSDIRKMKQVARMVDPLKVCEIKEVTTIPVMGKCRIGHLVEAQILEAVQADYIDESEVLTPANDYEHIKKQEFKIPFVCGAKNLGEALRRINEGASMIRTKGEPGTGNVVEAVNHLKIMHEQIQALSSLTDEQLQQKAEEYRVPLALVKEVQTLKRLPVVNFAAGGVATPADAALMMQLGADGIFVGSGIFKSSNPKAYAEAIVKAVNNYDDPFVVAEVSKGLGQAMQGLSIEDIPEQYLMANRGEKC
ncbi:MAG: pyridoxal 5'-phosphate synthase lyase subunit PdxS [Mycoplasmatales bacterium]